MKTENFTDLDEIDKQILKLKWSNRKLTFKQIGQLLTRPLSVPSVSARFKKPKMQAHWDLLEKDIIWQIKNAQNKAMKVILETLDSTDQKLAFQAACKIIDPVLLNCTDLLPARVETQMDLEFYEDEVNHAETSTEETKEATETKA